MASKIILIMVLIKLGAAEPVPDPNVDVNVEQHVNVDGCCDGCDCDKPGIIHCPIGDCYFGVPCPEGTTRTDKFCSLAIGYRCCEKVEASVCGKVNGNPLTRIVGGTPTGANKYPWQVALVLKTNIYAVHCGGSLINDRWVLTAAHCGTTTGAVMVLLGSYHADKLDTFELRVTIKNVVIHPKYVYWTKEYDFALLELNTILNLKKLAPEIGPVCLPSASNPSPYDDVSSIVTGWGDTSYGGTRSNVLLQATVETMSNFQCDKFNYSGFIYPSMICAAAPGKDACTYDSGGPLVTEKDGSFILIGVVSWGIGCAKLHNPGVYGRVTEAIEWIIATI